MQITHGSFQVAVLAFLNHRKVLKSGFKMKSVERQERSFAFLKSKNLNSVFNGESFSVKAISCLEASLDAALGCCHF